MPLFIDIASIIFTVQIGPGDLNEDFITIDGGMITVRGIAMLLGASAQPWYVFIPNFLVSYFVGALLYSLDFALGEEYGWLGYLQKKWVPTAKLFPFIVIGMLWGWWHLPGILLGHNYPDYPILGGFLLMPLVTFYAQLCLA